MRRRDVIAGAAWGVLAAYVKDVKEHTGPSICARERGDRGPLTWVKKRHHGRCWGAHPFEPRLGAWPRDTGSTLHPLFMLTCFNTQRSTDPPDPPTGDIQQPCGGPVCTFIAGTSEKRQLFREHEKDRHNALDHPDEAAKKQGTSRKRTHV